MTPSSHQVSKPVRAQDPKGSASEAAAGSSRAPVPLFSHRNAVFVALLATCLAIRIGLWAIFRATHLATDSEEYTALAYRFVTFDFHGYAAARTPIYPLILLATRFHEGVLWLVQSVMGIATSLIYYHVAKEHTGNRGLAFCAGAANSVLLNQLSFEAFVMTEAMAGLLLAASLFLSWPFAGVRGRKEVGRGRLLGAGIILGVAGLLRPLFLYLPLVFVIFARPRRRGGDQPRFGRRAVVGNLVLPTLIVVLGWSAFNYKEAGYFGLSTLSGYSLTNHSGAFIELVPERYAVLRDIYLPARAAQVAAIGANSGAIWRAYPRMMQATRLSFVQLSRELTRMSLWLFIHHPLLYARHVGLAMIGFWNPTYYQPQFRTRSAGVRRATDLLWRVQRPFLRGLYLFFFLGTLHFLYQVFVRRRRPLLSFQGLVIAMVMLGCFFQALVEYGENPRYEAPFQPLVVLAICLSVASIGCHRAPQH